MTKKLKRKISDKSLNNEKATQGTARWEVLLRQPVIHIVIIVFLGILIYSNTLHAPFVFDDTFSIVNNVAIQDASPLTNLQYIYNNRYIGFLSFALNYRLNGLNAVGYHIFNLCIHLVTSLFVYWLIILTFKTPYAYACFQKEGSKSSHSHYWIPLFSSLLFASHPVQIQAVTYIVQRFASLATLFYLASLIMYIQARNAEPSTRSRYVFYAVSIISGIVAMRTKEIAFTLPVVMILYEFMFFQGNIKRRLLFLLLVMLALFIIPLSTMIKQTGSIGAFATSIEELTTVAGSENFSRWDYLNTQFRVIVTYLRLLFLPINQNLDYDYPIYGTFFAYPVFLSFLLLLVVFCWGTYLLYRSYKSDHTDRFYLRLMSFGIFWFFVTLSVESSIFPIRDVIYEHRLYLPSVGFFMMITSGIAFICMRSTGQDKIKEKVIMLAMVLVVISLSVTSFVRNMVWSDKITLWEDVVEKSPYKGRPHYYLGEAYQEKGRLDDAIQEYQTTIKLRKDHLKSKKLRSDYALVHYSLGLAYQQKGRLNEAIQEYQTAVNLKPDYVNAHNNLGVAYHQQGRLEEAIKEYMAVTSIEPNNVNGYFNLGLVYQQQGRLDDAIQQYRTATKIKPDHADAHYYLALAHQQQGRVDEAIQEFRVVLNIKPDHAQALNNLGKIQNKSK